MVYYSNYVTEGIVFHSKDDVDDFYIIALTKNLDGGTFTVEVDFDDEWKWEFDLGCPANYEMVKHMIMDVAFSCENEDELLMELDSVFEEMFEEIVVWDDDCDGDCEHCSCKE